MNSKSKKTSSIRRRKGKAAKPGSLPLLLLLFALGTFFLSGCGAKSRPTPLPPSPRDSGSRTDEKPTIPDPNAPLPILDAYVEPPQVQPGEATELVWNSSFSERVLIDQGIGEVATDGRIRIFPEESTTYTLTADGPGGQVRELATVTVKPTDVPVGTTPAGDLSIAEQFDTFVKPVFFDFDSAELSREAQLTLDGNVRWLLEAGHKDLRFVLQGHCDQRGTEEYNLALGDKRARVVQLYLSEKGIDPARTIAVSLGEERPFAAGDDEAAHALNRRVHFTLIPAVD